MFANTIDLKDIHALPIFPEFPTSLVHVSPFDATIVVLKHKSTRAYAAIILKPDNAMHGYNLYVVDSLATNPVSAQIKGETAAADLMSKVTVPPGVTKMSRDMSSRYREALIIAADWDFSAAQYLYELPF